MLRLARLGLLIGLVLVSWASAAVEFNVKDLNGKVHSLSEYRGKWVLVNFWATWCPPCRDETPELVSLHNAHKDTDLVVLGVALDSPRKEVERFVSQYQVSYTVGIGSYTMASLLGNVEALPTSFLIDPNGKTIGYQEGVITRAAIEAYMMQHGKSAKK